MKETGVLTKGTKVIMEPVQWSTLNHIDEVEPVGDKDYQVLEEIRQVITKHSYENRLGATLLHKHFELNENEVALEETDEKERISTVRATMDPGPQNTIETMWRYTRNNGITEGFHNKMEMITRRAYGFRNFENYRIRVMTHCGWDGVINRVR